MTTPANHSAMTTPPANESNGWIAVDLDGTLARYGSWHGITIIGQAIQPVVSRIKNWLGMGIEVRIFTARASDPTLIPPIQNWLVENGLPRLEVTNRRDQNLIQAWDDRAVQIEMNTGTVLTPKQHIMLDLTGWIGVELDGTLACYNPEQDPRHIGAAVEKMRTRVQQWLMMDIDVRIFSGRASDPAMIPVIETWLQEHRLDKMKITCEKDFTMSQFWDDRGIHVVSNTGEIVVELSTTIPARKYLDPGF